MTNYVLVICQRVILNIKGAPRNQRKDYQHNKNIYIRTAN